MPPAILLHRLSIALLAIIGSFLHARPTLLSRSSFEDTKIRDDHYPRAPALRPILFLHGINGHADEFNGIISLMKRKYGPRAPIMHSIGICEGACSLLTELPKQREDMLNYLVENAESLQITEGFNFVAHSQGALLARSVIQMLPPSLKVLSYVSMAGPQKGQWGPCNKNATGIGPAIAKKMGRLVGWIAFYNPLGQRELSFANYWNDPRHDRLFRREAIFLPEINGYVEKDGGIDMAEQKKNFLRIKGKAVFLGSPDDDCINPPLSSVFQFVDDNGSPTHSNSSFEYEYDTFGLQSMENERRLVLRSFPGYAHDDWLRVRNSTEKSAFELHVLPHLQ